jgi:60 kDa SS-A/Ro ribonucleoprotein
MSYLKTPQQLRKIASVKLRTSTSQFLPIPGKEATMVKNNAGGFAFKADTWTKLDRFLILGSENGSYYCGQSDLTLQNVDNVKACIAEDGVRVVKRIVEISLAGRAPKVDSTLFALALCLSADLKNPKSATRDAATDAIVKVARTGTHLFMLCSFIDSMRGWGSGLRAAIGEWYTSKKPDDLAYQLVKYQQRDGWSHRDILRLAHPKNQSALLRYAIGSGNGPREVTKTAKVAGVKKVSRFQYGSIAEHKLPAIIAAFEQAKKASEAETIKLIQDFGLTHEMVQTQYLKSPAVWDALLQKMKPEATMRSLGRMSAMGLLTPMSDASKLIAKRLGDVEQLKHARIHPLAVLKALTTYKQGHGEKGKLKWAPDQRVVNTLDSAFYKTFDFVEPSGLNFAIGIDVSGSMTGSWSGGGVAGFPGLTPNMGAAAMAMLIARTEPSHFIGGFATSFVDLKISAQDSLTTTMAKCQRGSFGGTDTSVLINYAKTNKLPVDVFVVITDGETWAGNVHTCQALDKFRQATGRDAKLVVINMIANATSIADPADAGSLDIVGFDPAVPTIINQFAGAATAAI